MFFDGTVRLLDGTLDGKTIQPGELFIPFFTLHDNQVIELFLPISFLQYSQTQDYRLSLLINGKQIVFELVKTGDCRCLETNEEFTLIGVDGKSVSDQKIPLDDFIKCAIDRTPCQIIGNQVCVQSSTPSHSSQATKKWHPVDWACLPTDEEKAQKARKDALVSQAIILCRKAFPDETVFSTLTPENCQLSRKKLIKDNQGNYFFTIDMPHLLGSTQIIPHAALCKTYLTNEFYILLNRKTYNLGPEQTLLINENEDNQLAIFTFSEYGITREQMEKALDNGKYENGVITFTIPSA